VADAAHPRFADLQLGMTARRSYEFTEERVEAFAALVDDTAPVHTNAEFARGQGFDGPIVHGLFVQSIISGMLGMELPGARSVINSLNMKMHSPVRIGQTVDYVVELTALTAAVSAASLSFSGSVGDRLIISGKALCSFPQSA
jgi:3-hydroxybutyryl-CoA dehydratase